MIGIKLAFGILICYILAASCSEVIESETKISNYIVGGRNALPGQFPFMVALRTRRNQHRCGGCIISNRWILSAAHCTDNTFANPQNTIAVVGAHGRIDGVSHDLEAVVNHPRFNGEFLLNDVCVLRTVREIKFVQGRIVPARLPTADYPDGMRIPVWIAGWGLTQHPNRGNRGVPAVLQFKRAFTISRQACRQKMGVRGFRIFEDNLCTLTPDGKGACMGDSGGPLMDDQGHCVGIVSWGVPCGTPFPDVYARIFTMLPFIYGTTGIRPTPRQ